MKSVWYDLLINIEKRKPSLENQQLKVCLFQALGKFTTFINARLTDMQEMLLYMIHEEFAFLPAEMDLEVPGNTFVYILMTILEILHNEVSLMLLLKYSFIRMK